MSDRALTDEGENIVDHLEDVHGVENVYVSCGGVVVSREH